LFLFFLFTYKDNGFPAIFFTSSKLYHTIYRMNQKKNGRRTFDDPETLFKLKAWSSPQRARQFFFVHSSFCWRRGCYVR
jgi:hypothetical protein